jgi:uncharacterized membrane protein YeaQ/YmgE (transglycosylase-associated protein family)
MVEGGGEDEGEGVGEAVVGAVGAAVGAWLCRGWGCCLEEAAVSRRKVFYSLHWK